MPADVVVAEKRVCKRCDRQQPRSAFSNRNLVCRHCYNQERRERKAAAGPTVPKQPRLRRPLTRPGRKEANTSAGSKFTPMLIQLRETPPDEILDAAADWVARVAWSETPQVHDSLLRSLGAATLENRLDLISGEGWNHQRHQGVYLPRSESEFLSHQISINRANRDAMGELMRLITAEAGTWALDTWVDQEAFGPSDVVDLFRRAAQRARGER